MPEIPSLGRRGGGWVALQFALMAAVVIAAWLGPAWPGSVSTLLTVAGGLAAVAGVVLGLASGRALGGALTPYPRPSGSGRLVERGPYRVVRHPIYSAGILLFGGVATMLSPLALVPAAALALTWALKSAVEERFLLGHYPGYGSYTSRVRFRFVPYVY